MLHSQSPRVGEAANDFHRHESEPRQDPLTLNSDLSVFVAMATPVIITMSIVLDLTWESSYEVVRMRL